MGYVLDVLTALSVSRVSVAAANPTTSLTPYSANDVVGGPITFTSVVGVNGGSGRVDKLLIRDFMNTPQNAALELWLFHSAPTGIAADNAAWNVSDADLPNCIGVIPSGPYRAGSVNALSQVNDTGLYFTCAVASRDLIGYLVTRGTPTYGADAASIGLTLGVSPA